MGAPDFTDIPAYEPPAVERSRRGNVNSNGRPDRLERVLLPFWTSGSARKQLKYISIDEDKTQQDLLAEALNMLFENRGKPTIG